MKVRLSQTLTLIFLVLIGYFLFVVGFTKKNTQITIAGSTVVILAHLQEIKNRLRE